MSSINPDLQLIKKNAGFIAAVVIFYLVLEGMGITCPILFATGVSCAGCGMSRAWMALLRGDTAAAFYYHPLFLLPPAAVFVWFIRRKLSARILWFLSWAAVFLFISVYIARMLDPSDTVVVFSPQDGFIYRCLETAADTVIQILH